MANFNSVVTSFASGMVSPKFNGCSDISIYKDAVEELINMYPTEEGGARTRERFYAVTGYEFTSYPQSWLRKRTAIPYIDAKGNSYVFFFSYYVNEDKAVFNSIKWENGAWVDVSGGYYYKATNYEYLMGTSDLQWAYVGDAVIIACGTCPTLVVHRPSKLFSQFTLSYLYNFLTDSNPSAPVTIANDPISAMHFPAGDINRNPNFLLNGAEVVAATGTTHAIWALTFKDKAGNALSNVWNVAQNTFIKITNSTYTAIFRTRGGDANNTTSSMRADLIYVRGTIGVTNVKDWFISPWDNINGYPKCVSYFSGRLILGSTDKYPSSLWCSRSETIYRFNELKLYEDASSDASGLGTNSDGDTATSAFGITQGTTGAFCKIQWLHAGANGLYVGTSGGVELHNSASNGAFKVGNTVCLQLTNEGCAPIQPVSFSGAIIYVARDAKRLILITAEGKTTDLTALSKDYLDRMALGDSVIKITVNESLALLNILTETGKLFCLRLNVLTGKWGISYFETLWLKDVPLMSLGEVNDIALVTEGERLTLMLTCPLMDSDNAVTAYTFTQSEPIEYTTIGRDHGFLDFTFMSQIADSAVITLPLPLVKSRYKLGVWYQATSNNGWYYEEFAVGFTTSVTLTRQAKFVVLGFPYRQRIKSLDLEVGGSGGSTGLGSIKRISEIAFRVWNTISFYFGSSSATGETITLAQPTATDTVSTLVNRHFSSSPDRDCRVIIENRLPTPMYFSSIVFKGYTQE